MKLEVWAALVSTMIGSLAFAGAGDEDCREEALAVFISGGVAISSLVIGADDPCDRFGGQEIFTPVHAIRVYVNFNLAVTIDLDAVDRVFESKAPKSGSSRETLRDIDLAVVNNEWIKKHHGSDEDVDMNMGGEVLFISEKVIHEGRLELWLNRLYSTLGTVTTRRQNPALP